MNTDNQSTPPSESQSASPYGPARVFFRGFFIRLFYGAFAVPVLFLIRPSLFGERRAALFFALCVYSVVCLAGAIFDVSTRHRRQTKLNLWQKPRTIDVVIMLLVILALIFMR